MSKMNKTRKRENYKIRIYINNFYKYIFIKLQI